MKTILVILSIFISFSQCRSTPKVKEPNIKIQVRVIDKIDLPKFSDIGCRFYSAEIELVNNTDSVLEFWQMICSWQENWIFTSDSLSLFSEGCPKNIPKLEQIQPKEKVVIKTVICNKITKQSKKEATVKLGFVLIKKQEVLEDMQFYNVLYTKIKQQKDIIWSEPFTIGM